MIQVLKGLITLGLQLSTLGKVAEGSAKLWINDHLEDDLGHKMKKAISKAVKDVKDKLQTKFNKEQAVANPVRGWTFQQDVTTDFKP